MIKITRFYLFMSIVSLAIFYLLFISYWSYQQKIIKNNILQQSSYTLYKEAESIASSIKDLNEIENYREEILETIGNDSNLSGIIISYKDYVILSSIDDIDKIPDSYIDADIHQISKEDIDYTKKSLKYTRSFFIKNSNVELDFYGIIDHNYLFSYRDYVPWRLILLLGFPPLIIFIGVTFVIRKLIYNPLVDLGKYAYYSSSAPEKFYIAELEHVRESLQHTFERLAFEKNELFRMSTTDELSGLSNRTALIERIKWLIKDLDPNHLSFSLLYIDLDNFKSINDSYGHKIGDILLKNISDTLAEFNRDGDIIARVGGDEFIIVRPYTNERKLVNDAVDILESLSKPWIIEDKVLPLTSSIGIAIYPKDGKDVISLLKNADIALYEAKKLGKNRFHFFTDELNFRVQEELEIEREITSALENGEFELHYQPKIDSYSENIIGCEALIRWNHPIKGSISPGKFIPIVEDSGFIIPMGNWILREAIKKTKFIVENYDKKFVTSINVSVYQLMDENLYLFIKELLDEFDLSPKNIDLEITENVLLEKNINSFSFKNLNNIRKLGITISLDDFGTGYSSLSYLKNLPIDTVKLDKSFSDDFDEKSGYVVIKSIISLSHALGLSVVAEGVESFDQVKLLRSLSCESIQGFFYSKPLSSDDLNKFIDNIDDIRVFTIKFDKSA